jgi:uncharacterized protein YebE (UPF0316 family)
MSLDLFTILTGLAVFFARVVDVTLGTVRTLSIVHGRTKLAFFLGFVEISIWLVVISTVVQKIAEEPVLGVFYALGFASGNVVGIWLERKLAHGNLILRVIIQGDAGKEVAGMLRQEGYGVTTFQGEGGSGPVTELYIVCRRRDLKGIMRLIRTRDPDPFYVTELAGEVNRVIRPSMYRPLLTRPTGWRSIGKRK